MVVEFCKHVAWKVSGHTGGLTCSTFCGIKESNSQDSSDIGCDASQLGIPSLRLRLLVSDCQMIGWYVGNVSCGGQRLSAIAL